MADEPIKDAASAALGALGATGAAAAIGVFLKGLFTGSTGQEAEVRKALQEENRRLRLRAQHALAWQDLCLKARREAEKLGFAGTWPDDPEERDEE